MEFAPTRKSVGLENLLEQVTITRYSALMLFHDAFYRFVPIDNPETLVTHLETVCAGAGVLGSILVATEGINGMLCGTEAQLQTVRDALEADSRFQNLFYKRTSCSQQVFKRLKVKLKPEIVPLGIPGIDASTHKGTDLSPLEWREMLKRDDVIVIDNRNSFEFELGHFKGALNPGMEHFRDFAVYMEAHLPEWQAENKTVAMYCTGGIRCEKTSAWLAMKGVQILQLEGGILNYFQSLEDAELEYNGSCFVFDAREVLDTKAQEVQEYDVSRVNSVEKLFSSSRK
jgi:UPF0176 protein